MKFRHEYKHQVNYSDLCGLRARLSAVAERDPNGLYGYEDYVRGAETLYKTVILRAESIKGQLDGTIPSTESEQKKRFISFDRCVRHKHI